MAARRDDPTMQYCQELSALFRQLQARGPSPPCLRLRSRHPFLPPGCAANDGDRPAHRVRHAGQDPQRHGRLGARAHEPFPRRPLTVHARGLGTSDYICNKLKGRYKALVENAELEADLLTASASAVANLLAQHQLALGGGKRRSDIINSLDANLPTWPDMCVCVALRGLLG